MSNMSYCRFENTSRDLDECLDVMQGNDEYYLNVKKLSGGEVKYMEDLIETARAIVEIADNRDNENFFDEDFKEEDDES